MKTELILYPDRLQATLQDIDGWEPETLFALGTVSPDGPRLTYVAADGPLGSGTERNIVLVMLSPFQQFVHQIGQLRVGDSVSVGDIWPLVELDFGTCPTLVMINSGFVEETRLSVTKAIISASDEESVIRTWIGVHEHYGDPDARMSDTTAGERSGDTYSFPASVDGLASATFDPSHVWPEIGAFRRSWLTCIERLASDDATKTPALQFQWFDAHLWNSVTPSLWLPPSIKANSKPVKRTRLDPRPIKSGEELLEILDSGDWRGFDREDFTRLVRFTIFEYGLFDDKQLVPYIGNMYSEFGARGVDGRARLAIERDAFRLIQQERLLPFMLFPFLVYDDDIAVAANAAMDFVSASPVIDGELYAASKLRTLFDTNSLENRAAVFGGLVAMGEPTLRPLLTRMLASLSVDELGIAAEIHTPWLTDFTISFWLDCGESFMKAGTPDADKKFGLCAQALVSCLRYDKKGTVSEIERVFPCHSAPEPIITRKTWKLPEYAAMIAPRMHAIERAEKLPKRFPEVLRAWRI